MLNPSAANSLVSIVPARIGLPAESMLKSMSFAVGAGAPSPLTQPSKSRVSYPPHMATRIARTSIVLKWGKTPADCMFVCTRFLSW